MLCLERCRRKTRRPRLVGPRCLRELRFRGGGCFRHLVSVRRIGDRPCGVGIGQPRRPYLLGARRHRHHLGQLGCTIRHRLRHLVSMCRVGDGRSGLGFRQPCRPCLLGARSCRHHFGKPGRPLLPIPGLRVLGRGSPLRFSFDLPAAPLAAAGGHSLHLCCVGDGRCGLRPAGLTGRRCFSGHCACHNRCHATGNCPRDDDGARCGR